MKGFPMFKPGYYYLHANDTIIWKPKIVVETDPEYFNSPLVIKYWKVDTIEDFNKMKVEAKEIENGFQKSM
jgi:hypothetical protein